MVPLAAKIDPQIKQAGGRAHDHTERASNEEDYGEHKILHAQGTVKAVGMAGSLHIGYGSAFSQHLKNRVAGNEVDQKEYERDDEPYDRQRVKKAEG